MDGRWSLCLVAGLLTGVSGCEPSKLLPGKTPASPVDQSVRHPDPVKDPISNELVKDLKPKTLVAMGGFHIQMADEIARSPEEKEKLYHRAFHSYQEALKQDPKYMPALVAIAQLFEKRGDVEKAVAAYDAAIKVAPDDPTIWYTCGMCLNRGKQLELAAVRLKKAAELDPANRQMVSAYALTLARLGKRDECLQWLNKINTPAEAHFTLARMLRHMQDVEGCNQQLELALQSDPGHAGAQQLAKTLTAPPAEPLPGASMHAN